MDINTVITPETKGYILRAKQLGVAPKDISTILEIDYDCIQELLQINGLWYNKMPGKMPNSYYTERLAEGYTVLDMARELGCTRNAIYTTLARRGISKDAHRHQSLAQATE